MLGNRFQQSDSGDQQCLVKERARWHSWAMDRRAKYNEE